MASSFFRFPGTLRSQKMRALPRTKLTTLVLWMKLQRGGCMSEIRQHQQMHAASSEAVTNNVRVEVDSQYAPEHSRPFQNQWFFHYTVRITNEGEDPVQLISRH